MVGAAAGAMVEEMRATGVIWAGCEVAWVMVADGMVGDGLEGEEMEAAAWEVAAQAVAAVAEEAAVEVVMDQVAMATVAKVEAGSGADASEAMAMEEAEVAAEAVGHIMLSRPQIAGSDRCSYRRCPRRCCRTLRTLRRRCHRSTGRRTECP